MERPVLRQAPIRRVSRGPPPQRPMMISSSFWVRTMLEMPLYGHF
jgi:hypothetical protein